MRFLLFALTTAGLAFAQAAVTVSEGTITVPTYEHSARETEPPLFNISTLSGMYPFTTFLMPYKDGPTPRAYQAVFLENEYLKVTYISEFGGRIYSVFDKLRNREMLYRNDVVKPAPYNPRNSWPQSGLELTGPHDLHMLTLYAEPYWANRVVRHPDGSVSLALGEIDPVYATDVSLTATLHPGIAALEISVFCYNGRDGRKPQMFWINTAISATPQTRFIYPMGRTVGHTTADIADWPIYNGVDYSLDRNNQHMLGVFGIDIYDNFQGAYQFDRDYGIFRFADRRVVQGMKLWTFGYGPESKNYEHGYTDNAGPYVELQSGRHVWDGHYEWTAPHTVEGWNEWWIPVSQTGGLTTLTRDVALKLDAKDSSVALTLAATRVMHGATLSITSKSGILLNQSIDLDPAKPVHLQATGELTHLTVRITEANGNTVLNYLRPDTDPTRKEYTPFTRPLEQPRKTPENMSAEELTIAAEYRLKELDDRGAKELLTKALKLDDGNARAHTTWCLADFNARHFQEAAGHCQKAIDRDPYADTAYYYLAMSQRALGDDTAAERTLYDIWPDSAHYAKREYQLALLSLKRDDKVAAEKHLRAAGNDILSLLTLAVLLREQGKSADSELAQVASLNPTNRLLDTEHWLAAPTAANERELLRMFGGQTQEALAVTEFYRNLNRGKDAARLLRLTESHSADRWGIAPEFYYVLASADPDQAAHWRAKAKSAAGHVDRFPYRESSLPALTEAVRIDPQDEVARFQLACLLYFLDQPAEAIAQWEAAVKLNPNQFSARRALGLAYAEQGMPIEKAASELEAAIALNPAHLRTLDDLSLLYARSGRFNDQLTLLQKAQQRSPADDDLAEGILTAYLNMGRFDDARRLLETRSFSTRHRSYSLRDKYRSLYCALGGKAFEQGDYSAALQRFQQALQPPPSLGIDTFEGQTSVRIDYYIGRALEALGRKAEANASYERAIKGREQLTGDRDSWNSENFYMLAALDRLGKKTEASALEQHFVKFAETEKDSTNNRHRAEARYLLGLVGERNGNAAVAKQLFTSSLEAQPELLNARLELRGDLPPIQ